MDLKENVSETMGDEMLVSTHTGGRGAVEPIRIDTIKSTMDYDFMDKKAAKSHCNTQIKGRGRRGKTGSQIQMGWQLLGVSPAKTISILVCSR